MKEYQEQINNQLLSEKKQREQAALDEIRRAEAEVEASRREKEAAKVQVIKA